MKYLKIFTIITILLFGFSIGIIVRNIQLTNHYKQIESYKTIMKVRITKDYINVREQPTTKSTKLFEVLKNEQYEVIEKFDEETGVYSWYKIIFSDRRVGWITSYKDDMWVEEI